jgi:hypothetical protein
MSIFSDLAHPQWCSSDLETDTGGVLHLSEGRAVRTAADGTAMSGFVHVSVERLDADERHPGSPAIRIEGSGEQLSPLQAFELAATLQAVAIAALMGGAR